MPLVDTGQHARNRLTSARTWSADVSAELAEMRHAAAEGLRIALAGTSLPASLQPLLFRAILSADQESSPEAAMNVLTRLAGSERRAKAELRAARAAYRALLRQSPELEAWTPFFGNSPDVIRILAAHHARTGGIRRWLRALVSRLGGATDSS